MKLFQKVIVCYPYEPEKINTSINSALETSVNPTGLHPYKGYTTNGEMMQKNNINVKRISHYPYDSYDLPFL
ncbi:hypothetical protein [Zunongwangia profunda]|uniref:hypothetical protein n=1 Tax=Zunongwangia profunda TaxID=398743 RepID=UPI001D17ECBE|nr:hypothetical protein [Zunongwangia profunda]MCC4228976.1 hypothetical protein [Zunongwangia profunda]